MSRATGFWVELEDKELNAQIEVAMKRNPKATADAVRDCLLDLAGKSALRAPVDTGDLRNNCTAELNGQTVFARLAPAGPALPSLRAFGAVSYGLPYALRQHEELGYEHPKGGEAKYLEKPFLENTSRYIKRMERVPDEVIK